MSKKKLPEITHLQFYVLSEIQRDEELDGDILRERASHLFRSGPAFYQLMARLETAGLVTGTYHMVRYEAVNGKSKAQSVKKRKYAVTRKGSRALEETLSFYVGYQEQKDRSFVEAGS